MSSNISPGIFKYQVNGGDTLFILAKKYNVSLTNLLAANLGIDANHLEVGQTINLPINNPVAVANVKGGPLRPQIDGTVNFFDVPEGTWVCARINGLPPFSNCRRCGKSHWPPWFSYP